MALLVDEPRWPAHGRLWAHLVSDTSLAELHAFAAAAGVPARSFDADHYDVPEALVPALAAAGAEQVPTRELLARLVAAGLRVRQRDKPLRRTTAGLVLAAGAGTRFGGPKALARDAGGVPWLRTRVEVLRAAGCEPVLVVLGASAEMAAPLVPPGARVVVAEQWQQGMSASLQAGLAAVAALDPAPSAVLVALLDTPGLNDAAIERVVAAARRSSATPEAALARATYRGRPGHPVIFGRQHWAAASAAASGDRGAGPYLKAAGAVLVECADVADGDDVDHPPRLGR